MKTWTETQETTEKDNPKRDAVIFEGCDKTGKGTIYQAFRRATAYQPYVIDRWVGSNIVYDKLYGRSLIPEDQYWADEETFKNIYNVYLVVLTAPPAVLESRIKAKETGEDLELALANFRKADNLFRQYYKDSKFKNKLLLDTSQSLDQCIQQILSFMGRDRISDPGRETFTK